MKRLLIITISLCLFSFVFFEKEWNILFTEIVLKNPVKVHTTSILTDKVNYIKNCNLFYWEKGAINIAGNTDFNSYEFKAKKEGLIYYKINSGCAIITACKSNIMADYDKSNLVNNLRTL